MANFCGQCGTQMLDGAAFCTNCGARSAASPAATVEPVMPVDPVPVEAAPAFQPVEAPPAYQSVPVEAVASYPPQQPPVQPAYAPPDQAYAATPQPPMQSPPQGQWSAPAVAVGGVAPQAIVAQTKSSNTLIKIVLALVVLFGLAAIAIAGGLWYVGHKVVGKIKDTAAQAGISADDFGSKGQVFQGDPCRFLSKAEVGKAIGVAITETQSTADSCSYLAHGSMADMTSKHLSAMMGQRGADADTRKMIEKMSGGMAGGILSEKKTDSGEKSADEEGDTTVFTVSFTENSARAQMKLNSKVLGGLGGQAGSGPVADIGDEAFVAADGMLMVRKDDTLIRFMYTSCPCGTEQVKPLAKKVADAL